MAQGDLVQRMMGAATLNIDTYEEVEADETATMQAATVVAMAAVATAIGSIGGGLSSIISLPLAQIVGWLVWSGVTFFIGTKIFDGTATWGEMLRTLGFAQSPGVLLVLGIIPFLGGLIFPVVALWMLVAGVIAVRQALDFTTGKAVLTVLIGWVIMAGGRMILGG